MVNQRVFPLGMQSSTADNSNEHGSMKDILNVQFKQTYSRFLHQALHQDLSQGGGLNLIAKQKLQLAYFLQLQDRVDEAITVFKTIDIKAIQKGGVQTCQLQYDYMKAYFDFFQDSSEGAEFATAREIVKKYENCHIDHHRLIFKKIKEQLDEIDGARDQAREGQIIDAEDSEEADEEQKRQAKLATQKNTPVIHEIKVDQKTGEISVDSANIDKVTVKYYLIDAEILFSRSPFVKDQAM